MSEAADLFVVPLQSTLACSLPCPGGFAVGAEPGVLPRLGGFAVGAEHGRRPARPKNGVGGLKSSLV
jgi:hypothetical protein